MGIKNYLNKLELEKPSDKDRLYDEVYVDCNYVIHYLIYGCKCDKELYNKLFEYIRYIFNTITIKHKLYLIFDGNYDKKYSINPKIVTLNKRYKNSKTNLEEDNDIPYDKQPIMPNTDIIKTFKIYLNEILNKFKECYKQNFEIIFNHDSIDGEADIKILETIKKSTNKFLCIISKDTDMILISYNLILKSLNNNKLCIDVMCNLRPIKFVNINKMITTFANFSYDYIIILFFMGNDFIPSISNVDYDSLIECYKKFKSHYPDNYIIINNSINNDNLVLFITYYIIHKKIKFKFKKINFDRFKKYINNFNWCLKSYNIFENKIDDVDDVDNIDDVNDIDNIDNKFEQLYNNINLDHSMNVINVYNFIF